MIKFIISALGLNSEVDVAYITFTGKASEVLRRKGCQNAMTAHKLLYKSKQMSNGKFMHIPRDFIDPNYKVVVVDEISMLPIQMWELLIKHNVYILACGDPFQIPTIFQDDDNHVLDNPHIFLDEIMRQEEESSDIIKLSMQLRQMIPLTEFNGNDVRVLERNKLESALYDWPDQIITATNKTRQEINNYIRQSKGFTTPTEGDKVICLKNNWEELSSVRQDPLVNGTIGYLRNIRYDFLDYYIYKDRKRVKVMVCDLEVDDDIFRNLIIDYKSLTEGTKTFTDKQEYCIRKCKKQNMYSLPIEFNYGYAITCHRAQGSEYEKVLVIEESFPFDQEEHFRHLYTGLTRGSSRAIIIKK